MRALTRLLILALIWPVAGCDRALKERVEQVREFSAKEDRLYSEQALHEILREFWTLRDHAWLGKLPDGTIVRLDTPHATMAPLPSRAFYSGWHLQLTVTSEDWRTYPAAPHEGAYEAVYDITRHNASSWEIDVANGPATAPLHKEDVVAMEGDGVN